VGIEHDNGGLKTPEPEGQASPPNNLEGTRKQKCSMLMSLQLVGALRPSSLVTTHTKFPGYFMHLIIISDAYPVTIPLIRLKQQRRLSLGSHTGDNNLHIQIQAFAAIKIFFAQNCPGNYSLYLNLCNSTMAFDRPLEADQVDDLNLFSMLLRAPILGTLIWILGGDASRKEEEEARRREDFQAFGECKTNSSDASLTPSLRSSKIQPRKSALKKKSSLKIGAEVSDLCDSIGDSNASALQGEMTRSYSSSSSCSVRDSSLKERKKELSWSDESGHQLVKYDNEVRISNGRQSSTGIQTFLASADRIPALMSTVVLRIFGTICC
jgi:hypothetical protein